MNDRLAAVNALVGFVLPLAIAAINQRRWPPTVKSVVAFAACAAAGTLTTLVEGKLVSGDWLLSVATVFTVARVSYAGLWHPTKVAPKIENATSPDTKAKR